jgi:hypothetical protein
VRIGAGGAALALGLIMVIVGATVSHTWPAALRAQLQNSLVLATAGGAAPVVVARMRAGVYGGPPGSLPRAVAHAAGNAPDVNDTGAAIDVYVPSVMNVEAALLGAQPAVAELGPIAYRRYSSFNYSCHDCNVSGGVQTFLDRAAVRFDANSSTPEWLADRAFGGAWDTTYITVPNANLRALEARLASLHPALTSFEALATPLFSLQAVTRLLPALDYALRVATFPLVAAAMLQAAYDAVGAAGGNPAYILPVQFVSNNMPFLAEGLTLGADYTGAAAPGPMSIAVYEALFGYGVPAPFLVSPVSPLSPEGWHQVTVPALTACPAAPAGAACATYLAAFMTAVNAVTPGSYSGPADPKLARDALVIILWYRRILGEPGVAYASTFATYAAKSINTLQGRYGIAADVFTWPDAVWSQLANNGVAGTLAAYSVYFSARVAGASNATAVAAATAAAPAQLGLAAPNVCAAAQRLSLVDLLPPGSLPGNAVPELSCFSARLISGFGAGCGAKLSASALRAVFGSATDVAVASADSPVAATLLGGGIFPGGVGGAGIAGTEGVFNTMIFSAGAAMLAAEVAAAAAVVATGGPAPADPVIGTTAAVMLAFGALASNPTSAALQAAYAAAVAAADAAAPACPAALGNSLLLPLRCFEVLDLQRHLSHLAKDAVFDPNFARASPRRFDAVLGGFAPLADPYYQQAAATGHAADFFHGEASPLRAGPFLRCTLREYLEVGCHDNANDYFLALLGAAAPGAPSSRLPPVAPTSWEGAAQDGAWAAHVRANAPSRRRVGVPGSGLEDIDVAVTEVVGGTTVAAVAVWGGPQADASAATNPVKGSFSGTVFPPSLNVAAQDYAAAWPTLDVWLAPALRAFSLRFTAQVADSRGAGVKLWRYMMVVPNATGADATRAEWAAAIPRMKADDVATTPACAANLRNYSRGVALFLAPPYFFGCRSTGLAGGAPVPGYAWAHSGSTAALRNESSTERGLVSLVDVEPITGRALFAHRRTGMHLLWDRSPWFPLART